MRLALALLLLPAVAAQAADWRTLPDVEPRGRAGHTGAYVMPNRLEVEWERPPFDYDAKVATGRKHAKVIVLIYNPVLEDHDGQTLIEYLKGGDPREYSQILVDVIRNASWGYINYEIVDFIEVDSYPIKRDGFRYDDKSYLEARESKQWQPSLSSYRGFFEENNLLERFKREQITELWVWGADGFHFDEFAGYIPKRDARFGPTDNIWFYRPYDIPPELERTTWVMGFNVEVGPDNMIHSYSHRVESMLALQLGKGIWNHKVGRDPWNIYSWLEMDHGTPSMPGNCHVPPNGQRGYDYGNNRVVQTWAPNWYNYPDVTGPTIPISDKAWGGNQFGYQKWWLERLPKGPGYTDYGYNNWWVYIANVDEDLPEWQPSRSRQFRYPDAIPPAHRMQDQD